MPTANLGLPQINGSDIVDYTVFNQAFQTMDVLGKDYVTESAKSGDWWYRKWKSGRAECGIDRKAFGTVQMQRWLSSGLTISSGSLDFGPYPFSFIEAPFVSTCFIWSSSPSDAICWTVVRSQGGGTRTPPVYLVDANVNTSQFTGVVLGIYVCGYWKR